MKKQLTGLFRDQPETPEGKYFVQRRDGTIPPWPSFVLGGADPHAAVALRAYAKSCESDPNVTTGFIDAVYEWANQYDYYRLEHGEGDPGMGPHRVDDPIIVEKMKLGMNA